MGECISHSKTTTCLTICHSQPQADVSELSLTSARQPPVANRHTAVVSLMMQSGRSIEEHRMCIYYRRHSLAWLTQEGLGNLTTVVCMLERLRNCSFPVHRAQRLSIPSLALKANTSARMPLLYYLPTRDQGPLEHTPGGHVVGSNFCLPLWLWMEWAFKVWSLRFSLPCAAQACTSRLVKNCLVCPRGQARPS